MDVRDYFSLKDTRLVRSILRGSGTRLMVWLALSDLLVLVLLAGSILITLRQASSYGLGGLREVLTMGLVRVEPGSVYAGIEALLMEKIRFWTTLAAFLVLNTALGIFEILAAQRNRARIARILQSAEAQGDRP